jgi:hypothetical protein
MTTIQTLCVDKEDLEQVLHRIENTFSIHFKESEIADIKTYGDLCNIIISKVEFNYGNDSATQQAYVKLKEAIVSITDTNPEIIKPDVSLEKIFPKRIRRKQVKKLEESLGYELDLLTPRGFIVMSFLFLMIISVIFMFIFRTYGLIGLCISFLGLFLSSRLGNEFNVNTIKDLSEKIAEENYANSRRWKNNFNKAELEKQIDNLISRQLDIDKNKLKKEALL